MASENKNRSLNVSFGLNTSEFSKGVAELKQELSNLNAKFTENKQKITDTSKELKDLHEQQKKLSAEIEKSGEATEEQKEQMQELSEKIAQTTAKMGQLKAEEADIKSGIKTTTKELENQKNGLDSGNKSIDEMRERLRKLLEQEKELSASMKNGSTDEQNEQLHKLKEKISQTYTEIEKFRNEEAKLNSTLEAANSEFVQQTSVVTSNATKIKELKTELQDYTTKQKALADEMKNGATEEQKVQMQELKEKISQTLAEINRLTDKEKQLDKAVDEANEELGNQKRDLDANTKSANLFHNALNKLGTAAKAFIGIYGAKKLWEMLIGSNEEMEQYQTSFEVMLGDAEKAKTLITDIQNFAAKTPLTKSDSVSIGSLLMNYGVEADNVIDKMTQLGDLAGGNADKMNRIALAYGQMLAKGKVTGEELRQMTEAGVPLQNALAESIGVTGDEFSKMVSKGQVGIKELDKAIEELTTGGGKFAGMMEKQSQTMQGMLSTLQDNVSEFFRQLGEGAFGEIKEALSELMNQIQQWEQDGTLERWADKLGTTVSNLIKLLESAIWLIFEFGDTIIGVMAGVAVYRAADKLIKKFNEIKTEVEELGIEGAAGKAQAGFSKIVSSINPLALLISIIATKIVLYAQQIQKATSITENYNNAIDRIETSARNTVSNVQAEISVLKNKVERYDELRTAAELTAEQHAELKSIAEELQEVFGDEIGVVNQTTGAYNDLTEALETYTQQKLIQAKADASYNTLTSLYQEQANYKEEIKVDLERTYQTQFNDDELQYILDAIASEYKDKTIDIIDTLTPTGETKALYIAYANVTEKIEETEKVYTDLNSSLYSTSKNTNNIAKSTENLTEVYDAHKEAVENLAKSLNTVSSAYSEQAENGKLSYNTVMSLIDAGYASCLQIDEETGAVKLNAEAYKDLAKAKISARMADLKADIASQTSEYDQKYQALDKVKSLWKRNQMREFLDAEASKVASGSKAELAALQELYDNLDSYMTAGGSAAGKSSSGYSDAYNAYKTEADKKIELIKKELAAKKELRDKTIAYLDEEIQKRKELNQDDDMQKEIDKIKAQLDYAQLDDFSRGQLEKQLQKAEEERQEVLWQREMQRKKDEANAAYNAASENAAKAQEQISNAVNTVKSIMDNLAGGITNISNIINNNVNSTNNTANINLASQYLTMAQITKAVKDALIGTVLIR